jgi:hypothetical protein
MSELKLRILATRCCHTQTCPTILDAGEDVVIVGSAVGAVLQAAAVRERTGPGEAAVVIPKALLLEALNALR